MNYHHLALDEIERTAHTLGDAATLDLIEHVYDARSEIEGSECEELREANDALSKELDEAQSEIDTLAALLRVVADVLEERGETKALAEALDELIESPPATHGERTKAREALSKAAIVFPAA